ncbi:MAG: transglutaminase-like domain-containing protein [Candidatus Nanohaloarchaea archaeon]|nr:transglutaminase-like domain-containing protein [Candidatus Nanohaloarchaea archaeon]
MREYKVGGYLCPVDERTRETAHAIVTDTDDSDHAARELFHHVRESFCWDMTKIRGTQHLLAEEPVRAMSFDKSNLLVSLARSLGIPARFNLIRCTFHNEYKDRTDSSIHAPVELRLDGDWVTADPAFGEATSRFKPPSQFGEQTWEETSSEKKVSELPKKLVLGYNYLFRFLHPGVRRIRNELRECQEI